MSKIQQKLMKTFFFVKFVGKKYFNLLLVNWSIPKEIWNLISNFDFDVKRDFLGLVVWEIVWLYHAGDQLTKIEVSSYYEKIIVNDDST